MTDDEHNSRLITSSLFDQSAAHLERLSGTLPGKAIETLAREVILRVSSSYQAPKNPNPTIKSFAEALIGPDPKEAARVIERLLRDGVSLRDLQLRYLSGAAHLLGNWWDSDHISFSNVTVGTGRIYAIMRTLAKQVPPQLLPDGRRVIFASIPDDQHTLGIGMAADFARGQGWEVDLQVGLDHDELMAHLMGSDDQLIGLSGGSGRSLPALARLMVAIRVGKPHAVILVSGNISRECRDTIELMGTELIEPDLDRALIGMSELWDLLITRKT